MKYSVELQIPIHAADLDEASDHYDAIYDILVEAGYEPFFGEVGPFVDEYEE
jgi:hypothetical protein